MAGFFRQGPMSTRQSPLFHAFAISRSPGGFWESMMRLNSGLDRPFTQRRCRLYEYTMSDDEKSLYEVWMEKDVEILAKRKIATEDEELRVHWPETERCRDARRDGLLAYASPHSTRSSVAQKSGIEYGFRRVARTTLNVLARPRFASSPPVDTMTRAFGFNRPIFYVELDNLGEVVAHEQYDGDTVSITTDTTPADGVPDRPLPTS